MSDPPALERDLDILEMPVTGLAAYWLSVKKLRDTRKGAKIVQEEIAHTREPYVRHLLEIGFGDLSSETVRRLAETKSRTLRRDLRRKFDLMRLCASAMAASENPRVTLIKMNGLFSGPPVKENEVMEVAAGAIERVKRGEVDGKVFGDVDHALRPDQLILKLLYYALLCRREGRAACAPHLAHVRCGLFAEALTLLIDGFDEPFIRRRLRAQQVAILADAKIKMDMALEMCLGIKNKLAYADVFNIAKSYMVET